MLKRTKSSALDHPQNHPAATCASSQATACTVHKGLPVGSILNFPPALPVESEGYTVTPWVHLGVSKNRGTPKSSILLGFSIINHPFWDTPIFGHIHLKITSLNEKEDHFKIKPIHDVSKSSKFQGGSKAHFKIFPAEVGFLPKHRND